MPCRRKSVRRSRRLKLCAASGAQERETTARIGTIRREVIVEGETTRALPTGQRTSAGRAAREETVVLQVAYRVRGPAEPLAEAGSVVMRIGVLRIERDRLLVGGQRVRRPAEVLQGHPHVESGRRVPGALLESPVVMLQRRVGVARLVKKPPEVDVSVGIPRIDRQRAPVRLGGLIGNGGLQLAAPPVPLLGRKRASLLFLRLGERAARDRRGAAREIRDSEVEQNLSRLRLPAGRSVADDDALSLDRDADAPEPASRGELAAQLLQGLAHAASRDARREQAARGLQEHEILKGETEFSAASPPGLEESRSDGRANLARCQFQDPSDLGGCIPLQVLSPLVLSR